MPAESEVGNGQVPQLQVQNENNETVITQNGAPKKVEPQKTEPKKPSETENTEQCELKKVEPEKTELEEPAETENIEQCELKKEETENETVSHEGNQVNKDETEKEIVVIVEPVQEVEKDGHENQAPESASEPHVEVEKVETVTEPVVPAENELDQTEPEAQQSEPKNTQECELNKVDTDEDVPSCPIAPTIQVEEPKVESVKNGQENQDVVVNGTPKKVSMFTTLDTEAVKAAYEDVRSDGSETQWAVFKFENARIALSATGAEFEKFREQFTDNERGFGYIRIQTGDEMSKRQKFLFITWVGPGVSVIQRAKMSTDKSLVKEIVSNFAVELQLENESDFDLKHFVKELNKAGGANYGTGIRDS